MNRGRPHIVLTGTAEKGPVVHPEEPYPLAKAQAVTDRRFKQLQHMLLVRRQEVRAGFGGDLFVALEKVVGCIGPDTLQQGLDELETWLDERAADQELNQCEREVLDFARVLLEDVQVFDTAWRLGGVR
jgi:hypothetical protein